IRSCASPTGPRRGPAAPRRRPSERRRRMIPAATPRVRLLDGPTPLQRMRRIEAETGHRGLYVKRDDAMSLGLGGNKVRSLEFWIGEAMAAGADTLLVAGRAVSNQCRLTAAAAARLGLGCVVVHNDDPPS